MKLLYLHVTTPLGIRNSKVSPTFGKVLYSTFVVQTEAREESASKVRELMVNVILYDNILVVY